MFFFLLEILRNYTLDFKYMKMIVLNKSNILYFSFPWSSEWTGSGSAVQEKFRFFVVILVTQDHIIHFFIRVHMHAFTNFSIIISKTDFKIYCPS